jgi:hypothetical protein
MEENDTLIKVRGRIHDDELTDFAPLFGGTEIGGLTGAPKAWAMFPLADVERIEAREFPPASTAGDSPTVSGAGTVPVETKRAEIITTHRLKSRSNPLNAVIESAAGTALAPNDNQSVWAELVKLAESKDRPAPLVGYSSDGIQYRGKQYEETGELDTFTAKNLRDRMARAKAR